jgi:hypothetical protein
MAKQTIFTQVVVLICALFSAQAFQIFNSNSQQVIDVSQSYDKRAMTAYSFKAPFYLGKHFSYLDESYKFFYFYCKPQFLVRGTIPFWKFEGDTVVTDDYVRLTPAEKSRKGAIWNTKVRTNVISSFCEF